jgi:osmotically-inducible protein OsmY
MSQDSELQQTVLAELNWQRGVGGGHIGVTARDGIVTLSGRVDNYPHKHAAEKAARHIKGVRGVADEIIVELPLETVKTDAEIAGAAVERLSWDVSVPADAVKVTVTDGWVTLTGAVEWYYQRASAELDVQGLFGVAGVTNEVTIKPGIDLGDLSVQINHALNRSWYFVRDSIAVTAEGGAVHLAGTVHSSRQREVAAETAWTAPGVISVKNDIVVTAWA